MMQRPQQDMINVNKMTKVKNGLPRKINNHITIVTIACIVQIQHVFDKCSSRVDPHIFLDIFLIIFKISYIYI